MNIDEDYVLGKIEKLNSYLNDYSNEIPDHEVKSVEKFKCTNGAFAVLFGQIDLLKNRGYLPQFLEEEFDNFCEQYQKRRRKIISFKVTREDIERGNRLAEETIRSLQSLLP